MTDKSARQLQKKIEELERVNRDLDSTNRDLASSNQTLTDKNTQLEESVSEERNLWRSRHGLNMPVNADRAPLLHRIETLDDIINDKTRLYAATLRSKKEFEYILNSLEKAIKESKDAPLFCNNEKRSDDPGNRCSLYPRHALLMCLLRLKDNPTQGTLEAFFGIDQSTVSRYLQFCNRMLAKILPTPHRISREISKCKTADELKEFIPGKNARTILVDGTHIPVRRSGDAERKNSTYSGKKKTHTYNTTVTSAKNNIILGVGNTVVGKTHDITLFREDPLPFGRWYEKMRDANTPKDERFAVYMDLGYRGIKKDLLGADVILPHKKPKKSREEKKTQRLTEKQKIYNKKVGSIRVIIENSIGRIKQYARMTEPYGGTEDELNAELNIVAGLVNLHLMMTLQRGSHTMRKRFLG